MPHYARHRRWVPDATSKKHLKATKGLSQRDSTVLFQLRSGHAPLNAHLHRIKCADSPVCEVCSKGDEMVKHFVYECPAPMTLRHKLGSN